MRTITAQQLAKLQQNQIVDLVDVRTPVEFRQIHAAGARNVPLDQLEPSQLMQARNGTADEPLYLICHTGSRGEKACQKFIDAGFDNVVNVDGGTTAWESAQLPVTRGKKAMSLERQVRVLAGAIILVGALLALFVNRYFAAIPAFMGAGLLFAGITDSCAMGMMLAKMPWNQCKTDTCSA